MTNSLAHRIAECGRLAILEMKHGQASYARGYLAEREGLYAAQQGRYENLFVEEKLRAAYDRGYEDGTKLRELEQAGLVR